MSRATVHSNPIHQDNIDNDPEAGRFTEMAPRPSAPPISDKEEEAKEFDDRPSDMPLAFKIDDLPGAEPEPIVTVEASEVAKNRHSFGALTALHRGLQVDPHLRSYFLTIFYLFPALAMICLVFMGQQCKYVADGWDCGANPESNFYYYDDASTTAYYNKTFFAFLIIFPIMYFVYLCESFCGAGTVRYVFNKKNMVNAVEYMDRLCATKPQIQEHVECYHMETRTRTVASTDANGNTTYRTETYTVKVVTHHCTEIYEYNLCTDCTVKPDIVNNVLTKLSCTKGWRHADTASQTKYENYIADFKARHQRCDTNRTFWTVLDLPGFEPAVLAYSTKDEIPFAVRNGASIYTCMSFCGFSWLYRVWLSGVSDKEEVKFYKSIRSA